MKDNSSNSGNEVEKLILDAMNFAIDYNHKYVTLDHIFMAMLKNSIYRDIFSGHGGDLISLEERILNAVELNQKEFLVDAKPVRSVAVKRLFERAYAQAMVTSKQSVDQIDILYSLLHEINSNPIAIMRASGVDLDLMASNLTKMINLASDSFFDLMSKDARIHIDESTSRVEETQNTCFDGPYPGFEQQPQKQTKKEKILSDYCVNLTDLAKNNKIENIVGRSAELEKILQILGRKNKQNVVLVGDAGTGKSAIVDGLALLIAKKEVPDQLLNCEIFSLDPGALLAGTRYRGDFEERVKSLIDALTAIPNSILFVDEIHSIKGTGSNNDSAMDFTNMLKPSLARGNIKVIGTTTHEEYKKYFEKDKALIRRFYKVDIDEPTIEEAKRIIRGVSKHYEKFHNVKYLPGALNAAVDLSVRYLYSKKLPDKAFDLIDAAGSRKKLFDKESKVITIEDIEKEVCIMAKIPKLAIKADDQINYSELKVKMRHHIFGQDDAIDQVIDHVLVAKAGLREAEKPLLSALFRGQTGCGKTELAKELAKQLNCEFIRFDMSEYQEKHAISKLIGAPPGYVGFNEGSDGTLINAVEQHPNCVLLLDEVEKAHPDILNILLQVMDYGMLTSSNDKKVSFRNAIVIMTSNLGADAANKRTIGFNRSDDTEERENEATNDFFKPEFRNRLDLTLTFNKLSSQVLSMIVKKFIREMNQMLISKKIRVKLSNEVIDFFVTKVIDLDMGARPLSKMIYQYIKQPLSAKILYGEIKSGGIANVMLVSDSVEILVEENKQSQLLQSV